MNPRIKALVALLPFTPILATAADPVQLAALDPIIVSATRFAETDPKVPGNISVINREDIQRSPARNLPDLLKTSAGLNVSALYGTLGIDSTVDMRGFGDSAGSNTLILLDGQRLNPIDSGGVTWSVIPLESVERIEIIRGAGTILYGDRATGGVINIITDKSGKEHASLTANLGSYGARALDGQISGGNQSVYYNLRGHYAEANGWRQNTQADQAAVSGRVGSSLGRGELFADFAVYHETSGLPGSIPEATYRSNPRQAQTPYDTQRGEGYRLRPGVSMPITDSISVEGEISVEHESRHFDNVSFGSTFDRLRDTISLTPRVRWAHGLGRLQSETVAGLDYYAGKVDNNFSNAADQSAKQISSAIYLQNTTDLTQAWSITVGGRSQRMDQSADQKAWTGSSPTPAVSGSAVHTQNAWDAGLTYVGKGWRAYGKSGTTFRFANTDELFGFDPFTGNPVFAGDLKPQHGTIQEIGGSFTQGALSGRAAIYDLHLTDEIGFDSSSFANVNLDPTRRQGLETEFDWRMTTSWKTRLAYTYSDATFRGGINDGKQLPLAPRDKASLQLNWDGAALGNYTAVANYVGERRYSGDFANERKQLAGYTTVDFLASWDIRPWTITLRMLNAFDKRYAPFALYSTFKSDYYYFPADGRSVFLSARYNFK